MEGSPQTVEEKVTACEEAVEQCMQKVADLERDLLSLSASVELHDKLIAILRGQTSEAPNVTGIGGVRN